MIIREALMTKLPAIDESEAPGLVLQMQAVGLTDDQFECLCRENNDLVFEMTAQGELIIMSAGGVETSWRNAIIARELGNWAKRDGNGLAFDSSGIFILPSGAKRAPDASWLSKSRWRSIRSENRRPFAHICPDFVVELRSPSDSVRYLSRKMEEYIRNGAGLGWLLDPIENVASIFRPGAEAERIKSPAILSGDPVLPGFKFDFTEILNPPE